MGMGVTEIYPPVLHAFLLCTAYCQSLLRRIVDLVFARTGVLTVSPFSMVAPPLALTSDIFDGEVRESTKFMGS